MKTLITFYKWTLLAGSSSCLVGFLLLTTTGETFAQQQNHEQGETLFVGYCSRCHGIGGTGGEGPPLQGRQFVRATEESDLVRLVLTGISGTCLLYTSPSPRD